MKKGKPIRKKYEPKRMYKKSKRSKLQVGSVLILLGFLIFITDGFKIPLLIFDEEFEIILFILGKHIEINLTKSIGVIMMIIGGLELFSGWMEYRRSKNYPDKNKPI